MKYSSKFNSVSSNKMYPVIMAEYHKILQKEGSVNKQKFYKEFVKPHKISQSAWYRFIGNFHKELSIESVPPAAVSEGEIVRELVSAPIAIQRGIAAALNIGLEALNDILTGRVMVTAEKKTELLFKAMKAQDSRINAVARMKKDRREEVAFDKVFGEAAYSSDGDDAQGRE